MLTISPVCMGSRLESSLFFNGQLQNILAYKCRSCSLQAANIFVNVLFYSLQLCNYYKQFPLKQINLATKPCGLLLVQRWRCHGPSECLLLYPDVNINTCQVKKGKRINIYKGLASGRWHCINELSVHQLTY